MGISAVDNKPKDDIDWKTVGHMINKVAIGDDKGRLYPPKDYCTINMLEAIRRLNYIMEIPPSILNWSSAQTNACIRLMHCKPDLRYGDTGPYVKYLQYLLCGIKIDGKFRSKTHNSVIIFQHNNNIKCTGIVNNTTWAFLVTLFKKSHLEG